MMIANFGNYQRVAQRFDFDESQTVDFRDIMEGPAAIQAIPMTFNRDNRRSQHHHHQHNGGVPKKAESMPLTLDDDGPYSDMDGPYSDMEARLNIPSSRRNNDIYKRRGSKSPPLPKVDSKESFIQTV